MNGIQSREYPQLCPIFFTRKTIPRKWGPEFPFKLVVEKNDRSVAVPIPSIDGFEVLATSYHSQHGAWVVVIHVVSQPNGRDESSLRARYGFSRRESQVAALLAERRTDAEIASALGISWHTVRSHVERVFRILECRNRREAADKLNGGCGIPPKHK